jgi:hypothetical protein
VIVKDWLYELYIEDFTGYLELVMAKLTDLKQRYPKYSQLEIALGKYEPALQVYGIREETDKEKEKREAKAARDRISKAAATKRSKAYKEALEKKTWERLRKKYGT